MPELVGNTGRDATARPAAAARVAPVLRPPSSCTPPVIQRALPGMVARGHGVETLCLYLKLAHAALFDMIVALGLPTPHGRAHRRAGGRTPWQPDDVSLFIVLWMEGWAAASLAQRFGRSRAAVWSKGRQLGLPRRERRDQFRPADPHAILQPSFSLPPGPAAGVPAAAPAPAAEPTTVPAKSVAQPMAPVPVAEVNPGTIQLVAQLSIPGVTIPGVTQAQLAAALDLPPIARKGQRGEILHGADRDLQLALRHYGSQHYVAASREMGMSPHAYLSRRRRLGLKPMQRGEFVDEFNPEWAAAYIQAHGYRRVQCRAFKARGVEFYFWCRRGEKLLLSETAKQKAWCREALAQLDFGY